MEVRECGHGAAEFFVTRRKLIIGRAGHPRSELPQVALMMNECFSTARGNWQWQVSEAIYARVLNYGMDKFQSVGRRVFDRPAPESERSARRSDAPELRTAHSAGRAQWLDMRWVAIGRKTVEKAFYVDHFRCLAGRKLRCPTSRPK